MKFLFQSGTHNVKGFSSLNFENISSIIIRGENFNVTIKCSNEFCLNFMDVSTVKIKNMHIQNCNCFQSNGSGINYYITHSVVDLTGIIEIVDSIFTDSRLAVLDVDEFDDDELSVKIKLNLSITIKDTIFENCSDFPDSVVYLFVSSSVSGFLQAKFQNLNVRDNKSPFLDIEVYMSEGPTSFSTVTFTGYNYFINNQGPVIDIRNILQLYFSITEMYIINTTVIIDDGYFYHDYSPVFVEKLGAIIFEQSHVVFSNNQGFSGGIAVLKTNIYFANNTTVQFINNSGQNGGALYLDSWSNLIFNATKFNLSLTFINNRARRGGAIYAQDTHRYYYHNGKRPKSMFGLHCSAKLVKITFYNNSALFGGNQIYGGWVDWLTDVNGFTSYKLHNAKEILYFEGGSNSDIASDPVRICLCEDEHPNCNITNHSMDIYGYAVRLELVAVGQRFTSVPANVRASLSSGKVEEQWLYVWPNIESLQATCTSVTYKIYADLDKETLLLKPLLNGYCKRDQFYRNVYNLQDYSKDTITSQALVLFQQLSIQLNFKICPVGFTLHRNNRHCVCQQTILSHGLSCDLDNTKIHRKTQQWIGVTNMHTKTDDEYPGVIVHEYCPYHYCRIDNESLLIRLEDVNKLCAFNRSGILCGGCKAKFSRVLGSSKCGICSGSLILFAVIPGWLLSGLLLVIFLMLLDLTVAVGTINGLTFYANTISAKQATFFTPDISSSFLSKFISWLNLDQGIESCLYDGLDDYVITWLQFLFPLYIWLIAAALIVSSHYSTRISKLCGSNAVQVLATLFLLVYAKLLRLIITVFSFTTITYPDGYEKTVWLVDGNVDFLKGKHTHLFLMTILFVLLSLPYTFSLLTIQWLLRISHCQAMFWVQSLKPFFDAYTGPFKDNHRYWTGLLLIVRIILLTSFSLNRSNNSTINLFIIIVIIITLLIWLYFTGWVYKSFFNNCLEIFFLSNLSLTSTAALFEHSNNTYSPIVIYTSTGTAFVVFVGITLYHVQRMLFLSRVGTKLRKYIRAVCSKRNVNEGMEDPNEQFNGTNLNVESSEIVTCTVVELTQPLLNEKGNDHEDMEVKEPL